jgi:deoxyribodipyrimidine photolyase-related protein
MRQPTVGDLPEYALADDEVPWVLGTQLTTESGPLARAPEGGRVLMIEAHGFARRLPYHHHKLTLVFAAMRHFRDRLRERGYDVTYLQAETFGEALSEFFEAHDARLVAMRSPSHGSTRRFRELAEAAGGEVRFVPNELFVSTRGAFDEWADGPPFRHEAFYRWIRRETGVLMDDGDPVGGEFNYDEHNREVPPDDWEAPPVPEPAVDDLTAETAAWVAREFDAWGSDADFRWPVTREGARAHLDHFLDYRLPAFGPYQDAMRDDEWAMAHGLLSSSINLGLIHPLEVIERIERTYHEREEVPISSAEGAIRQVLGWREFVRHVYRRTMPDLAGANQLGADRDLPAFYWDGETDMACLAGAVGDVHDRGYAHHIQRLMVLANFATLWGVDPAALDRWFHATFVDAYHWVTTPNVVEMGSYGAGVFATKPYVASANYVDRMSDYCGDCPYDETARTGEGACPFNALYWDFLARNEDRLRSNGRMGLMYGHVDDRRESGDLERVRERVARLRDLAAGGEL